jgi:hypothetical protein
MRLLLKLRMEDCEMPRKRHKVEEIVTKLLRAAAMTL